jgi:branched-chain amino acid transport system permease protein
VQYWVQISVNALLLAGLYATMSYGLTMIYGVMKIINLAHAGFIMLGAYVTWTLYTYAGIDPFVSIPIVFALFFVVGAVMHRYVVRRLPVSETPTLPSLLLLFAVWLILRNIAYLVWTGDDRSILTSYTFLSFDVADINLGFNQLAIFVISVVVLVVLQTFLNRTYVGLAIRALTQNREASLLVGVPADRIAMIAFGLGTALAALAGSLMALLYSFTPEFGGAFLLRAFSIIVLGGLESFSGVALGALVLAFAESFAVTMMQASLQPAVAFTILVAALVIMPRGIIRTIHDWRLRTQVS